MNEDFRLHGRRDDEEESGQWERWQQPWAGTRGNGSPLSRGEFYARYEPLMKKLDILYDRIQDVEGRLVQEQMRGLAGEVVASIWGKLIVVVLAVLTAFLVSQFFGGGGGHAFPILK